jgi:hypothetical protein
VEGREREKRDEGNRIQRTHVSTWRSIPAPQAAPARRENVFAFEAGIVYIFGVNVGEVFEGVADLLEYGIETQIHRRGRRQTVGLCK